MKEKKKSFKNKRINKSKRRINKKFKGGSYFSRKGNPVYNTTITDKLTKLAITLKNLSNCPCDGVGDDDRTEVLMLSKKIIDSSHIAGDETVITDAQKFSSKLATKPSDINIDQDVLKLIGLLFKNKNDNETIIKNFKKNSNDVSIDGIYQQLIDFITPENLFTNKISDYKTFEGESLKKFNMTPHDIMKIISLLYLPR